MMINCPSDDELRPERLSISPTEVREHVANCRHCQDRISHIEWSTIDLNRTESLFDTASAASGFAFPDVGLEPIQGYRLVHRLGRGGYGEVWKAVAPGGVPIALKFLRVDEGSADIEVKALEFMKFVSHPHLLPIFGIWSLAHCVILGMELASCTLADRLRSCVQDRLPGIPFAELVEYMREAAKGIDFLNDSRHSIAGHANQSIVHRDIKPQNLLLVGGSVKVADFGLAKVMQRNGSISMGGLTPVYAAPELFESRIETQTDQYCLAVSYCQLRSNQLPFEGSPLNVMAGHLTQTPNLSILPSQEREVVARALSKEASRRWPNCRSFVEELANCNSSGNQPVRTEHKTVSGFTNSIGMKFR